MSALDTQIGGQEKLSTHLLNPQTQQWIESNVTRIPFAGCWVWNKSECVRGGYGQVGYCTYGTNKAHRLSYVAFKGDCRGLLVCHECDNPACVNPEHLFLGTSMTNHLDMVKKGRGNYARAARKMRKLTDQQVREIRASTLTQLQLAEIYGVSGGAIGHARRKQQYKEVV